MTIGEWQLASNVTRHLPLVTAQLSEKERPMAKITVFKGYQGDEQSSVPKPEEPVTG